MKRSLVIAAFAALTVLASSAAAEGKAKFPMTSQAFKQKHETHVAKAKAKLEEQIKAKNMDPEKAKLLRARFESVSTRVKQAVTKATADGTVTRDEAKDVHLAANEARREARKALREERKKAHDAKKAKASSAAHPAGASAAKPAREKSVQVEKNEEKR